ncbi:phage holin family protein [Microbacterium sp. BK668]|uniref:phage holin family protein n=1 Tax=Microbacterium sp. BK668 TaxID=2512118 RepID=UPI00105DDAC5|nr:phage holin family protein [Microbacterium sp. BK668]TDN91338.1 putative superfamily III holin-X [Microbacterium sp. BK668]
MTTPRGFRDRADESLLTLVGDVPDLIRNLVMAEVEAAKAWIRRTSKDAGIGSGWIIGALFLLFWSIPLLLAFIIIGLSSWMPVWVASLIVLVVLILGAALCGLLGYLRWRKVVKSQNPAQSIVMDVEAVRDEL